MNQKEFEIIVNDRLSKILAILEAKNTEYATNEDTLYNFKRAAEINRTSPAKALWGMASKHLVSVIDLVEKPEEEQTPAEIVFLEEKIGDLINYLILLEAIFKEYVIEDSIPISEE